MQNFQDPAYMGWQEPPHTRPKRTALFWIFVILPIVFIGAIVFFIAAGALFVLTARESELTAKDRGFIVDAHELADTVEDFRPNPRHESAKKITYLDRSYDLEYEYDNVEDEDDPYMYCCVTVESTPADALTTYAISWQTSKMGTWGGDVEVEIDERNDLFRWGDASRFAILKSEGYAFGNLFVARKGRVVFDLVVSGIYFDTADGFSSFVQPTLDNIAQNMR